MAISGEPVPDDVTGALRSDLSRFFPINDPMRVALQKKLEPTGYPGPGPEGPTVPPGQKKGQDPAAQAVYVLSGSAIATGASLDVSSQRLGWRVLAHSEAGQVATYVALQPAESVVPKLMNVQHGDRLQSCFDAVLLLANLVRDRFPDNPAFTVRLLRVPTLYTEALWLVPEDAGEHWLLPYRTKIPSLNTTLLVTEAEFLAKCREFFQEQQAKAGPGNNPFPPEI